MRMEVFSFVSLEVVMKDLLDFQQTISAQTR